MIARSMVVLMLNLCWASPSLAQGPPPPIQVPEPFRAPVEGYDLGVPYQLWRNWIERQKGPVTERALSEPDTLDGLHPIGRPLFTAAFHNDYGRFAAGEVRVFCTIIPVYPSQDRGECSYLYRRADVPLSPTYRDTVNALDAWMRANFDPALVVRNLRAARVQPGTDLWGANKETIFDGAASPQPLLTENIRVVRVDSRDCPALFTAMQAVEGARPDWVLDLYAVGRDAALRPPRPHAVTVAYTLNILIEGQPMTVSGAGALEPLLGPVLTAAYACEQAGQAPRS